MSASTSQVRMPADGSDPLAAGLLDRGGAIMSAGGRIDDAFSLAIQILAREAGLRGAEPADIVVGMAKALGTILAVGGVANATPVLNRFQIAALDYHAKSQRVLGGFVSEAGHG